MFNAYADYKTPHKIINYKKYPTLSEIFSASLFGFMLTFGFISWIASTVFGVWAMTGGFNFGQN